MIAMQAAAAGDVGLAQLERSDGEALRRLTEGGKENNWLQTVSGKSWFVILRMYGPLEPWLNKAWRPSEIELVK